MVVRAKRTFVKGQELALTTDIVRLSSFLSGATVEDGCNVIGLFNCSDPNEPVLVRYAAQAAAPDALAKMVPLSAGAGIEFLYNADSLANLWVAADSATYGRVVQDYDPTVA